MFNVHMRTFLMNFIQETCAVMLGLFGYGQLSLLATLQLISVPEPETTGMLAAALSLVCAIVRRRLSAIDEIH
jgi:hypothetical protein